MDKFVIRGGKRLKGKVKLSGSKNSALSTIVAASLGAEKVYLDNVPRYTDIFVLCEILRELGVDVYFTDQNSLVVNGKGLLYHTAPYELVRKLRGSFYVAGLLLAKQGFAEVPFPGGDAIGSRGIDFHLQGFKAMGADVTIEHGYVKLKAKRLRGTELYIGRSSVGATVNMILAGTLAEGVTTLENAAKEPEIVDLTILLNRMGAKIKGAGTSTIKIEGVKELGGATHEIIPDRLEAGTFLAAVGISGGTVQIENCVPEHLRTVFLKFQEAGLDIEENPNDIIVKSQGRLKAISIETLPYPGFPTDVQPQISTMLTLADGVSSVRETIWENRFGYADELRRMGANIEVDRDSMIIRGVQSLSGAPVEVPQDIRGAVALVLAGLAAEGVTEVYGADYIDRGYENIEEKLKGLGARIERIPLGSPGEGGEAGGWRGEQSRNNSG